MHTSGNGRVRAAENRGTRRERKTAMLWGAAALATVLTFGGLSVPAASTADTSPAPGTPETVAADALPTVQIDGVVYAQEVVGNTVYVGGSFTKARPAGAAPGTNETPRANLLAYDLTTGALISSWNPGTNNTVLDIKKSADGSRIYVAGMFSQAGGAWRYRVAAFDTATGALVTNWAPEANGRIDGLAVTESSVYLAGEFTTINGTQRTKVAAVSTTTGAVTGFTANVQGGYGAKAVVVSPDRSKVVVSGSFTSVNGSTNPGRGITALNATTGTTLPWAMNSLLRNGGASDKGYGIMYSLTADGDSVYGTAAAHNFQDDGPAYEGAFRARWSDGSLVWMEDCHGDTYDIALASDTVYVVGHPHDCTNIGGFPESKDLPFKNSLAFSAAPSGPLITKDKVGGAYGSYEGQRAPSLLQWYPSWTPGTYTGQSQGPWQVTSSGDYLLVGGEFLKVNGTAQQGIVRFAKKTVAPNKQGPQEQGSNWKVAASTSGGQNNVSWTANYDRDNQNLKYQVFRQDKGMSTPLFETTQVSSFWNRPEMSYRDTTATPGTTYNYRVKVIDPSGNSTQSDWTSVTTSAPAGPAGLVSGTVYTFTVAHSGKAAGVKGQSTADFAPVVQQTPSASLSQRWRADAVPGGFTLMNVASGKCLAVTTGQPGMGTDVLYTCRPGDKNQIWNAAPITPGSPTVNLVSSLDGRCFTLSGSFMENGRITDQYACIAGARNQQWTLTPETSATALTNGSVYTLTASHSGKMATIKGTANFDPVVQQSPNATANQRWRATTVPGGFTLMNVASGKCLAVTTGQPGMGTDVLYTCRPGDKNQIWNAAPITPGSPTVNLVSSLDGRCFTLSGSVMEDGGITDQYACIAGARNQQWTLTPTAG